ncbi:diacylglycerol kinase family lipid kinase [Fibrella sp. HMF5335]|uniref:Diacylglycerol kinase family lipid kinase n=1 Tax=Fibrella rubiginis TaxID=2817060 RepID=A0A939GC20_9BACT|nr:diacylglycerol kinase family protein [Fibrella rubiginis]MBO0935023.1 diacylglycerol kinase family lipid kinase [Fibrella rubiginis]
MNILFVINPVSGGKDKADWEHAIQAFCQQFDHTAHLLLLTGHADDSLLRDQVRAIRPDRVVAVGGDGTVKLVAEEVLGTSTPMGILPAGSANGLAFELNIPPVVEEALSVIVNGDIEAIDTICIDDSDNCLHLSDIGMNAQLVNYYQQNNWRGKLGYARGVFRVLLRHRLLKVSLQMDDKVIHRAAIMVVLANARGYGTGAVINPDGKLDDGVFEVVIVRRLSVWALLKMFWQYSPFDPSVVDIIPTKSVHITTRRKAYFQVDGEYRGRVTEIRATIRPGQVKMMVPKKPA